MKKNSFFIYILLLSVSVFSQIHEEIEVIGKLYTSKLKSKNIVVITGKDIGLLKSCSVSDVLRNFTAVNINRKGGSGELFDITMRGGNFEQVLILINGVPYNNSQTGHFNSDFPFQVKDIERIEIIKGGTSISYGSGAYSGVINIILKKEVKLGISVESGEKKFLSARFDVGKTLGKFRLNFGAGKRKSDGYYEGREFDVLSLTSNLSYSGEKFEMDSFLGYKKNDFGAAGFYAPFPSLEKIDSLYWQLNIKKKILNNYYFIRYSFDNHSDEFILNRDNPSYYQNESKTKNHNLSVSTDFNINGIRVNGGLNFKKDIMDSTAMGSHSRDNASVYFNLNVPFKNSGIDLGLRISYFSSADIKTNYYIGLYSDLSNDIKLKMNYGTSFRLPSFTELFYNSPSNKGDKNLIPESSDNFELSLLYLKGKHSFELNSFYREQSNCIDWVKFKDANGIYLPYWQAVNIGKNDVLGFEFIHNIAFEKIIFNYGIEKIFALGSDYDFLSKYGFRYPDLMFKLNMSYPIFSWLRITANYNYKKINNTDIDGHFLDLLMSFKLNRVTLLFRVNNVFNKIMEEIPGVKIPGIWAYIGLSYNLNLN